MGKKKNNYFQSIIARYLYVLWNINELLLRTRTQSFTIFIKCHERAEQTERNAYCHWQKFTIMSYIKSYFEKYDETLLHLYTF